MKKLTITLTLLLTFALLAACATEPSKAPEPMKPVVEEPTPEEKEEPTPEPAPEPEPEPELKDATLYIGMDGQFQTVSVVYENDLSPDWLIEELAQETGWNLTLSQPVIMGKSGFSISFDPSCALFTGPPDPQNEKYMVLDVDSMARSVLDSIQKTLQKNFVYSELGDPNTLDIYYSLGGEEPLIIPETDINVAIDLPYGQTEPTDLTMAMAFLGYTADGIESNLDETLNGEPYESFAYEGDEHYLLWVPDGMILVYEYDPMTEAIGELLYQTQPGARLHLTCNVSDIMSNVLVVSEVDGETATWMPSISLKDGTLNMGDIGYAYGSR